MSHSKKHIGFDSFFNTNIRPLIRYRFRDNQTIVTTRLINKTITISCGPSQIILIDNDGKITSDQVVDKLSDVSLSYIDYGVESIHLISDVYKLFDLMHELGYELFHINCNTTTEYSDSLVQLYKEQRDKFAVINKGDEFEVNIVNIIRKDGKYDCFDNCYKYALECKLNDIGDDLERDTNMTEIVNILKNNIENIYSWSHEPHVMYILTKKDVVLF